MKTLLLLALCLGSMASADLASSTPAGAKPDAVRVRDAAAMKWGMFICWSFSTFSGKEWTPGVKDIALFNPTGCDTDQWARTAREAGMGYILFLAKHHDGFCLWDTHTTDRKVTKSVLGRDVLAELRKSCDKHGLKLALYFSEGEWDWPDKPDGKRYNANGGYNPEMKKAQLRELLTGYGPIEYIWFDHAVGDGGLTHADTIKFVKSLQPNCFTGFNNGSQSGADIRLGEMGRPGALGDQAAAGPHMRQKAANSYLLAEFTYPILPTRHDGGAKWFYSLPKHDQLCLPAEKILADYLGAVKHGNLFSLDVGPDYAGKLREIDVRTLRKVGQYIRGEIKPPQVNASATPAMARPTPMQYSWHEQERIMFVCLDPATWQGREYDNHSTPLSAINPTRLDTDQWCQAAKLWGAKEILFVAKHTGGFCWWRTDTTNYGIKETAWKGGEGDVLEELSKSCRKHGLNLGVYVYPGDDTWGAPMGSGGRTKDPAKQDGYNKVFRQQLTEVLTRYGKMTEVWFDGSCVIDVADILRKHAPEAVVFQGPQASIRWPGTESGRLPYPAWNALSRKDLKTGLATASHGNPDGDAWAPLEADTTLYNHNWFWSAANEKKRKSLDELMDVYYKSAGHGGVLLLNSTPDTNGLIPDGDMKLYEAFGREIKRRFSQPVAETIDRRGDTAELVLPRPASINHAVIMEDYREGERVREYVVEGFSDGKWITLCKGTSVGRKKIDRFDSTRVNRVRLRVTKSAAEPIIRSFAAFNVEHASAAAAAPRDTHWKVCGEWKPGIFHGGAASLSLDLSQVIPMPGQFEVRFEETGGKSASLRITKAVLFHEGEEATPGLLTPLATANSFNINRTAQVTHETRTVLKVEFSSDTPDTCEGKVWIRPATQSTAR